MVTTRARQLVSSKVRLPSQPDVMQRLTAMLKDPEVGVSEIGALIAEDPALAGKVLKLANSAFYGLQERCLKVQQAASVLGLKVLRNVILQASVMQQFEHLSSEEFDVNAHWRHSLLTAHVCARLAGQSSQPMDLMPEELYACGLLHDVGQLILLEALGKNYIALVIHAEAQHLSRHAVEIAQLGFSHADVGALVAEQWGLPPSASIAIGQHHDAAVEGVAALVKTADLLVHALELHVKPDWRTLPENVREVIASQSLPPDALWDSLERFVARVGSMA
jgi:HD-like signal output (HDOD) protein